MFTKHLESQRQLTQLISPSNCQLREGRAESAPQLKRAQEMTVAHVRLASTAEEAPAPKAEYHFCGNRLPHHLNPKEIRRCFLAATAAEELYSEEDQTQEAELTDPVPALERRHRMPAAQCRTLQRSSSPRRTSQCPMSPAAL